MNLTEAVKNAKLTVTFCLMYLHFLKCLPWHCDIQHKNIQHNDTPHNQWCKLRDVLTALRKYIVMQRVSVLSTVILSSTMLSAIMLNAIMMLSAYMLSAILS